MNGNVNYRDILGKDISVPDEMAEICKNGLILKNCPSALGVSMDILEEMTAEYISNQADASISSNDLHENDDIQTMVKRMGRSNKFCRNVLELLENVERVQSL